MRLRGLYATVYVGGAVLGTVFGIVWWIVEGDAVLGVFFLLLGAASLGTYRLLTQPMRQRARREDERDAAGAVVPVVPGTAVPEAAGGGGAGGHIVVERPRGYYYAVFRGYRIRIDGLAVGSVRRGQSQSFPVSAGRHSVAARIDWSGSPEVTVEVPPGGRVVLEVEPSTDPIAGAFSATKSLTLTPRPAPRTVDP